jgi:hypothetical protein
MPSCRFFKAGPDGCYGNCGHPEANHEPCIYNSGEDVDCILREPVMTSMQISRDTLEALREYGYPAEKAVIRLLEIARSLP